MSANNGSPALGTYFAIALFAIGKNDGSDEYYREDSYLIRAESLLSAREKLNAAAHEQESVRDIGDDRCYVRLARLVDLAPMLYDAESGGVVDLYSRHFASLTDYAAFEMKLGGRDPLEDDSAGTGR